jgi:hypothetical protein
MLPGPFLVRFLRFPIAHAREENEAPGWLVDGLPWDTYRFSPSKSHPAPPVSAVLKSSMYRLVYTLQVVRTFLLKDTAFPTPTASQPCQIQSIHQISTRLSNTTSDPHTATLRSFPLFSFANFHPAILQLLVNPFLFVFQLLHQLLFPPCKQPELARKTDHFILPSSSSAVYTSTVNASADGDVILDVVHCRRRCRPRPGLLTISFSE